MTVFEEPNTPDIRLLYIFLKYFHFQPIAIDLLFILLMEFQY
jgi:hypothetical protein